MYEMVLRAAATTTRSLVDTIKIKKITKLGNYNLRFCTQNLNIADAREEIFFTFIGITFMACCVGEV
jgi:hypothetical protein